MTTSRSEPRACEHLRWRMVVYTSMRLPDAPDTHVSAKWCEQCGALGWTDYHGATRWTMPTGVAKPRVK